MKRWQEQAILKDLEKKMVLIVGPRQVGKTYLAKQIAHHFERSVYLNYDQPNDREIILRQSWLDNTELLILDELHKFSNWKNYLKGLYDTKPATLKIIVTGSARLDLIRQFGDSLAGRFFLHRLMPLSPAELNKLKQPIDFNHLITRGGFPEPYLAKNAVDADRWRMQYINSLLSIDAFDLYNIRDLKAFKLTFELLRHRVGSPISYKSLSEDVAVSPNTIKQYIQILESLYVIFRIPPYHKNIARSILKEPKIYFFDNALVEGDQGPKLENLVAICLMKNTLYQQDYFAKKTGLYYLRTKEKKEVDFATTLDNKIENIIEVKNKNNDISPALEYFHQKYQLNAIQLVKELRQEKKENEIKILKLEKYLTSLAS